MRRFALATIVLLGLTVSCAPTTTPEPQVPVVTRAVITRVVTATPWIVIVTATPEPTDTPTLTPTVASSPVLPWPTETATATPQPEITLSPMHVSKTFNLQLGKDAGAAGFTNDQLGNNTPTSWYEIATYNGIPAIHAKVTAAGPKDKGNQRPYPEYHNFDEKGDWALEFTTVIMPGTQLFGRGGGNIGYDSVVSHGISSVSAPYNIKGGLELVTKTGKPHLEAYRVENQRDNYVVHPDRYIDLSKVPEIPIGAPFRIRVQNRMIDGQPVAQYFVNTTLKDPVKMEFDPAGWKYIDSTQLDSDATGFPGRGFRVSAYTSWNTSDFEVYNFDIEMLAQ